MAARAAPHARRQHPRPVATHENAGGCVARFDCQRKVFAVCTAFLQGQAARCPQAPCGGRVPLARLDYDWKGGDAMPEDFKWNGKANG